MIGGKSVCTRSNKINIKLKKETKLINRGRERTNATFGVPRPIQGIKAIQITS